MRLTYAIIISCCFLSSGCSQLTKLVQPPSTVNLGQYYQWLKTLDDKQLASEISYQQKRQLEQVPEAELYMLLLHSLPSTSIHNPYTAKSMLNEHDFNEYIYSNVTAQDLAFITLLRDQLNQQLLLIQANDKQNKQAQREHAQLTLKLAMHEKAVKQLEQQLTQLKAIETQLSTRGNQ